MKSLARAKLTRKEELRKNAETLIDAVDNELLTPSAGLTAAELDDVDLSIDADNTTSTTASSPGQSFHLLSQTENDIDDASDASEDIHTDGSNPPSATTSNNKIDFDINANESDTKTDATSSSNPWETVDKGTFAGIVSTLFGFFFALSVIYPFVPFMVSDFYPKLNETELGYYVGYLESAFYVGTILAAVVWARLADRFGRRPIIMSGLGGTLVCAVLFGLSGSYAFALCTRFAWGALDGNVGVVKTMLGEIATPATQARLYSVIGLMSGLGRLSGSLVGGWLADVSVSNSTFFDSFPYALPCLISGFTTLVGLLIVVCCLKETMHGRPKGCEDCGVFERCCRRLGCLQAPARGGFDAVQEVEMSVIGAADGEEVQRKVEKKLSALQVIRMHDVWVTIGFYGMLAFVATSFNATFSVWVITPKDEFGFGWKASNIGSVFAICGPIYTLWQVFVFPVVVAKVGFVKLATICMATYGVMSILLPHLAVIRHWDDGLVFGVVTAYCAIGFLFRVSAFTCVFAIVNNAADSSLRATVNGLGQSVASFGRILAPTALCNLFAWSCDRSHVWPFNYVFAFYVQGLIGVVAAVWLHFLLPKDYEARIGKHNKRTTKKLEKMENEANAKAKLMLGISTNKAEVKRNNERSKGLMDEMDVKENNGAIRINYGIKAMDSAYGLILPKSPSQSMSDLMKVDGEENRLTSDDVSPVKEKKRRLPILSKKDGKNGKNDKKVKQAKNANDKIVQYEKL